MTLFKVLFFLITFLIVIKLFKMIIRFLFSYKKTVNDLKQQSSKKEKRFDNVEEADFREIPLENKNESENYKA